MVVALGAVLVATKAGACRVDSMGRFSSGSGLRGAGRPAGGLYAELLCVLGVQSLPAAELHGIGADDASDGLTGEGTVEHIEVDVPASSAHRDETTLDVVPEGEPGATGSERLQLPADVLSPPVELQQPGRVG